MKKSNFRLKKAMIFMFIAVLLFSCSKENYEEATENENGKEDYMESTIKEYKNNSVADKHFGVSPFYIFNEMLKAANAENSVSFFKFFRGIGSVGVKSVTRENLYNDIYKYSFIIQLGDGKYNKIGVYRVVKEIYPWFPARTKKSVMMIPGDNLNFSSFLALSDVVSADRSMAVSLAKKRC